MSEEIKTTEKTGNQDPFSSFGAIGSFGALTEGAPSTSGIYSYGGGGGGFGGCGFSGGFLGPYAAALGSGTIEGKNPYSPPPFSPWAALGMLPGCPKPFPGTYAIYRLMSSHPTLTLAKMSLYAPILAAGWSVDADKDKAPSDAREFLETYVLPLRIKYLSAALRFTEFGWAGFEKVYGSRDGYVVPKKLKALLPELTDIQVDATGNLAGVKNTGVDLDASEILLCSHAQEGSNYYGIPRHENARRSWSNWLAVEDNLYRLGRKTASVIPHIGYPPGPFKDTQGNEKSNFEAAMAMAYGMSEGKPSIYPNLSNTTMDDLSRMPEMARASLWSIGVLDMGNPGPAQMALIEHMRYLDMLLVRGWMRPERSLLEARHSGSRADSQTHGDLGTSDCDLVHGDLVEAFNDQVVDDLMEQNFGPKARGTARFKAIPLVDEKRLVSAKLLDYIGKTPGALAELILRTDMKQWQADVGLPVNEDAPEEWDGIMLPRGEPNQQNDQQDNPDDPDILPQPAD